MTLSQNKPASFFNIAVIVAALGYFVDVYYLLLFTIVKKASVLAVGATDATLLVDSSKIINWQMAGLLLGGWESGVLKFKFKYNNDTIIQEQYGSNNGYDVYKINDTVDIYYNPNASATSIICVKLLSRSNRGFIIMILGTLLIIVILLYKIKTYKGEMLFLED